VLLYVGILWAGDRQLVRETVSSALAGFGRRQGSSESLGAPIVSATPTSEELS
jgi:hypothetical protein